MLNLDEGHLDQQRIQSHDCSLKRRIVYSEQQVNKAIFRGRGTEQEDHNDILASERVDMSSLIYGGAGTGKYLFMCALFLIQTKSLTSHILFLSRENTIVDQESCQRRAIEEDSHRIAPISFSKCDKECSRKCKRHWIRKSNIYDV